MYETVQHGERKEKKSKTKYIAVTVDKCTNVNSPAEISTFSGTSVMKLSQNF